MAAGELTLEAPVHAGKRLPTAVLVYHGIGAAPGNISQRVGKYWVGRSAFDSQLELISQSGRKVALLHELELNPPAARGSVVITFDDGLDSDYEQALPALQRLGYRAMFFVNPMSAGQAGFMSWGRMREMAATGMSIQSHGWTHTDLTRLSALALHQQLRQSREEIENRVGREVRFLAVPFGEFNQRVLDSSVQAGYRAVFTSQNAPAHLPSRVIPRAAIYRQTTAQQYRALIEGARSIYLRRQLRAAMLYPPKFAMRLLQPNRMTAPAQRGSP